MRASAVIYMKDIGQMRRFYERCSGDGVDPEGNVIQLLESRG